MEDKIYPSSDGLIIGLIGQGLSQIEICFFLPVGGYMLDRIIKDVRNPERRIPMNSKNPFAYTDPSRQAQDCSEQMDQNVRFESEGH